MPYSRRQTLALLGGALGAGLAQSATAQATAQATAAGSAGVNAKIDVHQHYLPKVYVDAIGLETLASVMPNKKAPQWSAEGALAMMDGNGIQTGMLSISSGPRIPDAAKLLRKCNDEAALLRTRHPGRFGLFASLPLPDMDASLKEISYSSDTLGAEGFIIFTNYGGRYLGDPIYAPVFEELNRRKAVVLIHPNEPDYSLTGLLPASVLEFPFDTTRAASSLLVSGALNKWPEIRFILSHAGGALPYLAGRLAGAVAMTPALREVVGDPMAALQRFWYDTALSVNAPAMSALLQVADPAKIVFGTDFPMAPPPMIRASAEGIAQLALLSPHSEAIARTNAVRLFSKAV